MIKFLAKLFLWFCILCVLLFVTRNSLIKGALSYALEKKTGLQMQCKQLTFDFSSSTLNIKELVILNSAGFDDPLMFYAPEIKASFDFKELVRKGNFHFKSLSIDLREFNVIKNKEGRVNLEALKLSKSSKTTPSVKKREFKIDILELKIGKVKLTDYTKSLYGDTKVFLIYIDEKYEDIADFEFLKNIILVRALAKTTISEITNLDIPGLTQDVNLALNGGIKFINKTVGTVTGTVKTVIEQTFKIIEEPFKTTPAK